ncbi:uncharacterized protein B0H18DRAFT_1132018 [Fomitopsis serialis]|uniref:uncharacterized protein n=1 Tax=Fomitopsis serialis TaxID=139415 RepID=UPI002007A434|nr:uncharacterized protein B0H18DRAFT_1132018 [Neoantrodia serialis]KAH9906101.1 hypothetical protein B0H18DRAFT_1132018 [Neoantrodia serialis]
MILAAKKRKLKLSVAAIWRDSFDGVDEPPKVRTFQDWNTMGIKFTRLAGGGSLYLLVLVAAKNLRIPIGTSDGHVAEDVGNLMRWPNDTPEGRKVVHVLIPALALLRNTLTLRLSDIIPVKHNSFLGDDDCSNIDASDKLFDGLKKNAFCLVPRCTETWRACYDVPDRLLKGASTQGGHPDGTDDLAGLSPLTQPDSTSSSLHISPMVLFSTLPEETMHHPSIPVPVNAYNQHLVHTTYNAQHPDNTRYPLSRGCNKDSFAWTERARVKAGKADAPASLEEFQSLLSKLYVDGKKSNDEVYIRVPLECVQDVLTVRDADNNLMVCICTSMPASLKVDLTSQLVACFPINPFKTLDTATLSCGQPIEFAVLYFTWYNRHCTKGHDAPVDVPPRMLSRANCSRTNYAQMLPYPSKDIEEHRPIYDALKTILNNAFCWIEETVRRILPEEYSYLDATASILPDHHTSPVHPFLGLVINATSKVANSACTKPA